jgi:hypothetical protein
MGHSRDQHFYDTPQIEEHLMCLWEEDYVLRSRPEQEIRAKGDPAIGPNLPVVVADIRSAWKRAVISELERSVVVCRGFWGMSLTAIAEHFDEDEADVAAMYDNAIEQIIDYLGGRRG